MNLPQLTAIIGRSAKEEIGSASDLAMLVKAAAAEGENQYVLFMTFDLVLSEIRFEEPVVYNESDPFKYHYFGNNSAAGSQYYLTRDGGSVYYLLKSVFSDLQLVLKKNQQFGELADIIANLGEQKLVFLGDKKGAGTVNLNKIKGLSSEYVDEVAAILPNKDKKLNSDDFIRKAMGWDNKGVSFEMIVPRVVKPDGQVIVLSQHEDYIAATKKEQSLESAGLSEEVKFCYICNRLRSDASSELTTKFSRSGINKLFGTTTLNAAKNLSKKDYDDSYAMCSACFQDLLFGEKRVVQRFFKRIANERAFILPEGLLEGEDFDYNFFEELKKGTDLFWDKGLSQAVSDELEMAARNFKKSGRTGYVVHFVIYRTDGNSVTVLQTIEDVPTLHILRIVETIGRYVLQLHPYIRSLSLGEIYRMIPVRTNKKGEQLDIRRVLSVYQSLFSQTPLETNVLFGYAAEAIEKGFRELRKKQSTQYPNMGLAKLMAPPDMKEEVFIGRITMKYICLLHTCQELNLLDRPVFQTKGGVNLDVSGLHDNVKSIELFLDRQGFANKPRALFYLGMLLRGVVRAQLEKNHKSKPVLNKITFQGMNQREILWLYQEILEKLHQYRKLSIENEHYMKAFNEYYGLIQEKASLTDQEHVFYLMAGYAFSPAKLKDQEADNGTELKTDMDDEDDEIAWDEEKDDQE